MSTSSEATSRVGSSLISSAITDREPCIHGIDMPDLADLLSGKVSLVEPPGNAVMEALGAEL